MNIVYTLYFFILIQLFEKSKVKKSDTERKSKREHRRLRTEQKQTVALSLMIYALNAPCTQYTRIFIPIPPLPQTKTIYKVCFHLISNHILSYKWQRP